MLAGGPVLAAVSSQQADRLGSEELTRFGAPRAGSEDGVIPQYTGGLDGVPDRDTTIAPRKVFTVLYIL